MARTMQTVDGSQTVEVHGFFMTRPNWWEFYLLDNKANADVRFALVDGFAQDMGDIYMRDYEAHICSFITDDADLADIAPAPGWVWVDNG